MRCRVEHMSATDEPIPTWLEAVKLDPRFVAAYYKMFETYFDGDSLPPHYNKLANMRMVADKLQVLSPDSAQYHTVNSLINFYDWKFEEAIKEAALAKKIDPNFCAGARSLRLVCAVCA